MRIFNRRAPRSEPSKEHMMTLPVEAAGTAAIIPALAMETTVAVVEAMVTTTRAPAMEAILGVVVVETITELPAQHQLR